MRRWTLLSLALPMEADDVRRCVTCAEPDSKGRSSEHRAWQMALVGPFPGALGSAGICQAED
jgi:hypothetical protein